MKKLIPCLVFAAAVLLFSGSPAQAGHSHYNDCGHSGYHSYRGDSYRYGYNDYRRSYRRPHYGYNSYPRRYSGYNSYSYSRPYYRDYYHDHYYRGSSYRCHYYGGRHNYNYRPHYRRSRVHIGISIFR